MGSGLGMRQVISGVLQEIRIRTNFVHFINQWSGKKKEKTMQSRGSTHFAFCVAGEWQPMRNKRSCNQVQKDLYKMYRQISHYQFT